MWVIATSPPYALRTAFSETGREQAANHSIGGHKFPRVKLPFTGTVRTSDVQNADRSSDVSATRIRSAVGGAYGKACPLTHFG
jgi:hypothetical protein